MAYNTFGPGIALDKVTMRGLPAQPARIIDAVTGDTVQAFTMGEDPTPIVLSTNTWGYFPQFQTIDLHEQIQITFGRLELTQIAWEIIQRASNAEARVINLVGQYGADVAAQNLKLNNVSDRLQSVETLGGLAPGDVSDATVKSLIVNPGSQTGTALSAAIDERVRPKGALPGEAADLISGRLAFHTGDIAVGIASDSTSDGATDWVRLWLAHVAQQFPALRIENNQWVDAQGKYGPTTVVQPGDGEPAFSGDILHDTFARTANLATPDSGGPWEVTTPAAWTLDGQAARTTGVGRLRIATGSRDTTSTTVLILNATGTGTAQNLRLYHGDTYGMFAQIAVNGGGLTTAYLYRVVNGVATEVTNQRLDLALGVPVNANAGQLTVTISGSIQVYKVTIKYGAQEWTHEFTITESAYAAMEPFFALYPQSAIPGIGITESTVAVADRPATYQTLRVWSGTKGGGDMQYQMDNWAAMFGSAETGGTPPGTETRTITDAFARSGQIAGSNAATGETWQGAAVWTADGTAAVASGAGAVQIIVPGAVSASANVEVTTTIPPAAETLRLGLRAVGDRINGFYVGLGLSTAGAFTASAYVRTTAGGFRDLGPVAGHGIVSNTATPQTLNVSMTFDGLNITVKAGPGTSNYTITQAESDQLGLAIEMQAASLALTRFRVLDMEATHTVETPGTPPAVGKALDVMILAHGHNYGSMGPAQYIEKVEEFRAFMAQRRPNTALLLCSQNPQFAPSANPPAHAARLLAVRSYARQNGIAYAPVFEHFAAQPDGGRSWVLPDGVHPIAPPTPLPAPGYGMSEWGKVLAGTVLP